MIVLLPLLAIFCFAMYYMAIVDLMGHYGSGTKVTWKDYLFTFCAPVTMPCKMAVILWILFFDMPFSGRRH